MVDLWVFFLLISLLIFLPLCLNNFFEVCILSLTQEIFIDLVSNLIEISSRTRRIGKW